MKNSKKTVARFYNRYWVILGTFLWWPLAGVYLIYKNYINLKNKELAKKSLLIGSILTVLIVLVMYNLPDDFTKASYLIPIFISYRSFNRFQWTAVEHAIKGWWKLYSFWNAFGIGILFLAISVVIILLVTAILWQY